MSLISAFKKSGVMLLFKGEVVFTDFRLQQKIADLNLAGLRQKISELSAHYIYFFETKNELVDWEKKRLRQLLTLAEPMDKKALAGLSFFVVPRIGTISPWSSKATEIAKICGLSHIRRLERGMIVQFPSLNKEALSDHERDRLIEKLHDPLTESVFDHQEDLNRCFEDHKPSPLNDIDLLHQGKEALLNANQQYGLALTPVEMDYLVSTFQRLKRNPTDVELMMFSQINSEHCRHKIFNAKWIIDGEEKSQSLFSMITHTYQKNPNRVLVAYKDNAAVIEGPRVDRLLIDSNTKTYVSSNEPTCTVFKVETHNHPTAISPFPGAATGSGGEIRDEAATGRGAVTKAGLCGFSVSHLCIPNFSQPWEIQIGKPKHMASALEIMLQGPIGAASFNNEFGRPNICGYFRTLEMKVATDFGDVYRGYHKPIMIAGGIGVIRKNLTEKKSLPVGTQLIVLGGPSMVIGLGGGSASSLSSGLSQEKLDFASVQRSNPEMQRRCQEVINACWSLGDNNPILSIHDVGAGGLSNALPEIVEADEKGAWIDFRKIPSVEKGMSPLALWCNEAQERFVLAINADQCDEFAAIASRERCPFAVVGEVNKKSQFVIHDTHFDNYPVNLPLSIFFSDMPREQKESEHIAITEKSFSTKSINVHEAAKRVLQFPCVADKSFLITIGDRSVGGMVARDQMVGPWQVPVSDVAVTTSGYHDHTGEALAMGERAPIALLHHAASARMAVGEAITNIAAASIEKLSDVVLSANWMVAPDHLGEGAGLYDAVTTIGMELCPALGINIPVGKDSLSMRTVWRENEKERSVTAPLSLIISATANVLDVRKTMTPQLQMGDTQLIFIDLGGGCQSLGGSVLAQTYQLLGQRPADLDDPQALKNFFNAMQALHQKNLLLAYHDRSDGGLFVTLCEMAFAGHVGITVDLQDLHEDIIATLFNEELGAVLQIKTSDSATVFALLKEFNLDGATHIIGHLNTSDEVIISSNEKTIYRESRADLWRLWSETSFRMQALRDNPDCAQQEYDQKKNQSDPGLTVKLTFDINEDIAAPYIHRKVSPKVAILREQGVNGHREMAAAFHQAGFTAIDVHMSDLIRGKQTLRECVGLVACGGFSYGDVLGAGRGWAQSILMHSQVRDMFAEFFERADTFSLGVCNGCQMFAHIKELIPGAQAWPIFKRNESEQFEARFSLVEIPNSPSLFFKDMAGSCLPITVAHGEGQVFFENKQDFQTLEQNHLISLRYVDHSHQVTKTYPYNPNGSVKGMTGFTSEDGRATILMPHPERVFRTVQHSWHPNDWKEYSPWMRLFRNARCWVD